MTNLERIRMEHKLSQNELARRAGISQPAIWGIERKGKQPRSDTLVKLACALGCAVGDLIDGEGVNDDV